MGLELQVLSVFAAEDLEAGMLELDTGTYSFFFSNAFTCLRFFKSDF